VIPRLAARLASGLAVAMGLALLLPATVAAHALNPTYTSRLPLAVYLVGAATAVALSFAFVIVRDVRAAPPDLTSPGTLPPAWLRIGLRVIGLIGWLWIIGQGIAGGASDGEVATLFLWNYGWVGLAIICAIIGPAWHFIDPFSTIHDGTAWILAMKGLCLSLVTLGLYYPWYGASIARFHAESTTFQGARFRLAGARHAGRPDPVVRGPRRVHGLHAGDDGPVRARRMALTRRDVHGLVPSPRPAGLVPPG
jgi:hypothetical protein